MFEKLIRLFRKEDGDSIIDFQQGLDLTGVPVCTFRQGSKSINLMLDTGASKNLIDKRILKDLDYKMLLGQDTMMDVNGNETVCMGIHMDINFMKENYSSDFMVCDMSRTFEDIKKSTGVTIHGILGSGFFRKYRSVLDFGTLKIHLKKEEK